jgi:hypothetical protein
MHATATSIKTQASKDILLYGRLVQMKMEQSDWFSEQSESCSPDQVTVPGYRTDFKKSKKMFLQ